MAQEVKYITVNPGEMASDAARAYAFRCFSGYGGLTVVAATVSTGVAGTLDMVLQNYGSAGTVAGATIGHMSGGTATVWAADTPQAMTLTAANVFVDENEYVYLKKLEAGGSDDLSNDAAVCIAYVDGVVSQG